MILFCVVLYLFYFQVFWQGGGVLPGGGLLPSEVPHRGIHQGHQGRRGQAQIGPHTHSQVSNPPLRNKQIKIGSQIKMQFSLFSNFDILRRFWHPV